MFFVNDYFGIGGYALCDIYCATTIGDFIENRKHIKRMPIAKLVFPLTWFLGRDVIVCFGNVQLAKEEKKYVIYDINGELSIDPPLKPFGWRSMNSARPENMENGFYHEVFIRYSPHKDFARLHGAERFGPPQNEPSEEEESEAEKGIENILAPVRA